MEEFLPLIIGFIWLAYTWYNKNQKKKQAKDNPPGSEKKAPSILEQLIAGESIPFSQPEPVYEEIEELDISVQDNYLETELETELEEPDPFLNNEFDDFLEEGQSVFGDTYINSYDEAMNEGGELENDTLGELKDFDLKKAVILSEILNAPYIDYK